LTFLDTPSRHLFFTGKGGVGKTSLACAAALALADRARRVLVVSTDPASNLDEVFGTRLGTTRSPVPGAPGLWAMNLDPEQAAREYRERVVGPYRGLLPDSAVAAMEEQLSGACTVEVAAFDEFARLLGDPSTTAGFDHVVFDTAPTGHTLRLLSLPSAWAGFIQSSASGTSCLGPLSGLQAQQGLYRATVAALSDPSATTLVLVSRPEVSALLEAERSRTELAAIGVANQQLVLNGLFVASDPGDLVARAFERRGREALRAMPEALAALPRTEVPLAAHGLNGVAALRAVFTAGDEAPGPFEPPAGAPRVLRAEEPLDALIDELAAQGSGLVLAMGKGGVGKTTVAAAVASELARRGRRVRLTTTDPAAHVEAAVGQPVAGLTVSRIDPRAETRRYAGEVMASAGASLDTRGRELLEEDLRSPCTEEVAVFRAFADTVAGGQDGFIVLDTAPTGHTILLLDAALAYHREVARSATAMPDAVRQLLPRLRDPDYTRVLLVTLPEATPVHEAAALQADLVRAGIRPFAWVINQSLSPLPLRDPLLRARAWQEAVYMSEVVEQLSDRVALIPWQAEPPVGVERLRRVAAGTTTPPLPAECMGHRGRERGPS
jgi:arsenite-transporting ATPase